MRVELDTREFDSARREWLLASSRELSVALNASMFYMLLRAFVLVPPMDAGAQRAKIKGYLTRQISERFRITTSGKVPGRKVRYADIRQFQLRHKIVQAKRRKAGQPGLYGKDMRRAAGALLKRAVGSVGYLKSCIVRAIRKLQPGFTQFGTSVKTTTRPAWRRYSQTSPRMFNGVMLPFTDKREVQANSALMQLARDYGAGMTNVAVFKSSKAAVRLASPSANPEVWVQLSVGIANDQMVRVTSIMQTAFQRAMDDEARQMREHVANKMQALANTF